MELIRPDKKYSLSLYFFLIAISFIYLNFMRATFDETGQYFGPLIRMISVSAGPFFLLLCTVSALAEGQLKRINREYQLWIICLIFIFIGLIINGVLINRNSFRLITLDTIHYLFFLPGILIGAKKENWPIVDRFIRVFFLINTLNLLPFIGAYSDLAEGMRRNIVLGFDQIPYFFWGELGIWTYLWLTMKDKSQFDKLVTVLGTILFFYFAIIFLKRAPFVNLFMFFVLIAISDRSRWNLSINLKTIASSAVAISLAIMIFATMEVSSTLERLGDRFSERGDTLVAALVNSNRISYDAVLVIEDLNGNELLVGRGMGGVVKDPGHNYPELKTSYLHNSSVQHVLKGGVLLLIVWWLGFLRILKDFFFNKDKELNPYYIHLLGPFLFSWVFGFLSTSITFLLLMLCAGRVMSKKSLD